jgi:enoyl-CoA hydratase/carnithine racemase
VSIGPTSSGQDDGAVLLERTGPVAELTLSRPSAMNAMTWGMYEQLGVHLEQLVADEGVRAIILRGAGTRAFAAGTDIRQFEGFTAADGVAYERRVDAITERLASVPKPLIAAVQGYAVGGGLVIATTCDLRYATPDAQFGVPVARTLGNCLSLRNARRVASAWGAMRAKEMLFTGRLFSAEEALRAGFLTAIVPEEHLLSTVREVALGIAQNAPLTVWAEKEAFRLIDLAAEQALDESGFEEVIRRVYGSEDFAEGVRAHTEKRRARWRGR